MCERPELNSEISVEEFRSFYWLKEELVAFCRSNGMSSQGGKIEIADRIEIFLSTGKINPRPGKPSVTSRFDWKAESLSRKTVITDNYQNTENVRNFFKQEIGSSFKFNVVFMNWMKANTGKTLGDATEQWKTIAIRKTNPDKQKEIAPQFEYNRYIRDFIKDNPGLSREEAIKCWNLKKQKRGSSSYERTDLKLK